MLTIVYVVNGREHKHSGRGEAFTRFLRKLNADGIQWSYATDKPQMVVNLFANLVTVKA